ncbi:hypothetical protein EYD45_07660 [Hyunsoonleella flava]|uniref:DUF4468 domain-containing protein n=1 Tax=Hyunsoonleella flava TaxID=2527939 RepID=A0A4Q9FD34_9FLAO|nr:hypothetical protein [Hyunsoonleella flava]TBN03890.1 hypothetical protein EYD45_07660 [Hyunsoonleella flava]
MKKVLKKSFVFVFHFSVGLFSQNEKFELTPQGFKNANDTSIDYVIIDAPNLTKSQLYRRTLDNIKDSIPSINFLKPFKKDSILVKGFEFEKVKRNFLHFFDISYAVSISLMDDKIKIYAPTFKLTGGSTHPQTLHLVYTKFSFDGSNLGIYGKKDKLKSKKAKVDLENYFNNFIKLYASSINN